MKVLFLPTMFWFGCWIAVVATVAAASSSSSSSSVDKEGVGADRLVVKDLFHSWMQDFGIQYTNAIELAKRMQIWTENHGTYGYGGGGGGVGVCAPLPHLSTLFLVFTHTSVL